MATFAPIITTSSPVTVTSGVPTITYEELLNSIRGGGWQDKINTIYIYASSFGQLSQNWTLRKPTQSGIVDITPTTYLIDPTQKQPTAFLDLKQYDFVLDTLSTISLNMQPYSSCQLVLFTDSQSIDQAFKKNNFVEQKSNNIEQNNNVIKLENNKNEVAKKVFVAAASVGIVYLIISKL